MINMTVLGVLGLLSLFALLALRMPVALSMLGVGFIGTVVANTNKFINVGMASDLAWARGWKIAYSNLAGETFEAASNFNLLVIPMFVLMGNLAGASGMSNDLFTAAYRWMGHLRGGLASATIAACAGFAALSGSSLASAVTMGRVALPEMKRYKYSDRLATGSVAAGGTLGFLIPPSGGMIIYAVLTEQSIGRLFMAGVFPGHHPDASFHRGDQHHRRAQPGGRPARKSFRTQGPVDRSLARASHSGCGSGDDRRDVYPGSLLRLRPPRSEPSSPLSSQPGAGR